MRGVHVLSALVLLCLVGLVWWFPVAGPADLSSTPGRLRPPALYVSCLGRFNGAHMTLLFLMRR